MKGYTTVQKKLDNKQERLSSYYQTWTMRKLFFWHLNREKQFSFKEGNQADPQVLHEDVQSQKVRAMSQKFPENYKGTQHSHTWPNYYASQRQKEDIKKYSTGTQHPWALPEKWLSWNPAIESMNADNTAGKWVSHSIARFSEAMFAKSKGQSVTHDGYSQPNRQLHISATKKDF